jgi:transposase
MQPYSIDFRQKILEVREQEKISIRELAKRFRVAKSFVQKLLSQVQKTGDIRPRKAGGSPPKRLNNSQLVTLIEIIEANQDATLEELVGLLEQQTGIKVSRATMGRLSLTLNYSLKKNAICSGKNE